MFNFRELFAKKQTFKPTFGLPAREYPHRYEDNFDFLTSNSRIRRCKRESVHSYTEILAQLGSEKIDVIPDGLAPPLDHAIIEFGNIVCAFHATQRFSTIKSPYRTFQDIFPSKIRNKRAAKNCCDSLGRYFHNLFFEYQFSDIDIPDHFDPNGTGLNIYAPWYIDYVNKQDNALTRSSGWRNFMRLRKGEPLRYEVVSDITLYEILHSNREIIPTDCYVSDYASDPYTFLKEYFEYYLLAMDVQGIPIATMLSHSDVVAQIGVDVNVHMPFFESFFQNKTVEDLFENTKFSSVLDSDFLDRVKVRCTSMCTVVYNLCRWSQGKLLTPDLIVNLTSALITCLPLKILYSTFERIFGTVAQDDMATMTIVLKCICVALFLLVAKALPGKKTVDELINRVHTIPRAMSGLNHFWSSIDSIVQKAVDLIDEHIYGHDVTAKQATYIDTVQKWADEVASYTDIFKRREINRDPETLYGAARLHMTGVRLLAQCQKLGYDRRNAELIRSLLATTFKISEAALKSGADKSRVRMEPVMVWFNGPSGIGKSTMSYPFILDIMKAVGQDMSKWESNIYARVPETEYWDGYVDQEYIIYDDAFQLRDSIAKPSIELFEMIRLGNLFPYQLHMASIEEKNNTFAQPKMVYLSSNLSHIKAQSIHFPEAVERRIDFAYHVTLKEEYKLHYQVNGMDLYKLDVSKCKISPEVPIDFDAYLFTKYDCHTHKDLAKPVGYAEMVKEVIDKMLSKQAFYSSMSSFLHAYKDQPIPEHIKTSPQARFQAYLRRKAQETGNIVTQVGVEQDYEFLADNISNASHWHGAGSDGKEVYLLPGYKYANTWYESVGCVVRNQVEHASRGLASFIAEGVKCGLDWWSDDWHIGPIDCTKLYMAADNFCNQQEEYFDMYKQLIPINPYTERMMSPEAKLKRAKQVRTLLAGQWAYQSKDERFYQPEQEDVIIAQVDEDRVKHYITRWKKWVSASFWATYRKIRYNLPGLCLKTLGIFCAIGAFYRLYTLFGRPVVKTLSEKVQAIQNVIEKAEDCVKSGKCSSCRNCKNMTEEDLKDVQYWGVPCKCYIDVCKKQKAAHKRLFMAYINSQLNVPKPTDTTVQARMMEFATTCDCLACPLCDEECECRKLALQRGVFIGEDDLLDRTGVYSSMQHELNTHAADRIESQHAATQKIISKIKKMVETGEVPAHSVENFIRKLEDADEKLDQVPVSNNWRAQNVHDPHAKRNQVRVQNVHDPRTKKNQIRVQNVHDPRNKREQIRVQNVYVPPQKREEIVTDFDVTEAQGNLVSQAKNAEVYDFNGQAILENRLWPNLMRMYIVRKEDNQIVRHFGHVLGLKGSCFLMNWHFVICLRNSIYADCEVVLRSMQNTVLYKDSISNFLLNVTQIPNKDACVVVLARQRTMQSYPNILKHFQSKATNYSRELQSLTIVRYSVYSQNITPSPIIVMDAELISEEKEITMYGSDGVTKFINPMSWQYMACTRSGDCGAPLLLNNSRIPEKIVGIHNAAHLTSGVAFGVPLFREEIEQVLSTIPAQFQYGWEDAHPVNMNVVEFQDGENFLVFGSEERLIPMCSKTSIRPSLVSGELIQPQTMPGFLRPFQNEEGITIDPVSLARKKWGYHQPSVNFTLAKKATSFCVQILCKKTTPDYREYFMPLTTEEAIVGIPGIDHLNSINKTTSPGYPYVHEKLSGNGKTGYFGKYEFDLSLPGAQEVISKVADMERMMLDNVRPRVIWIDTMKDARIPIEKAMKGKTRVFSASPMDYVILYRKYFLPFYAHIMHNRISNFTAPGINATSPEWHQLALRMKAKGPKCIAGDYSNYDGKACVEGYKAALEATVHWYRMHWDLIQQEGRNIVDSRILSFEQFEDLLRKVFFEVVNHIHACNFNDRTIFYQVINGMPSGNPGTAVTNSVCGVWMFVYCWLTITDTPELRQYNNVQSFYDNVYMCTYGDDVVANISDSVINFFNQQILTTEMKKNFDIDFTDEAKTGEIVSHRSLDEVRFLKRAFVFNEYLQLYVSPLPEEVILDISNFVKIGGELPKIITIGNLKTCMAELSLISREIYDKYRDKIVSLGQKLTQRTAIVFLVEEYETYMDRFRNSEIDSISLAFN